MERLCFQLGNSAKKPAPSFGFRSHRAEVSSSSEVGSFREQARRRERKLAESHEVRYRLADDPEQLQGDLDSLFRLRSARWDGKRTGLTHSSRRFTATLRRMRLNGGGFVSGSWTWTVNLRAACYGFRFGDVESFYQSGRDPSRNRSSRSFFIILLHSIRGLENAVAGIWLLRGDEPYSLRFDSSSTDAQEQLPSRELGARESRLSMAESARRSSAFRKVSRSMAPVAIDFNLGPRLNLKRPDR